jgi:type II secretory pathway pseudopilin PulG
MLSRSLSHESGFTLIELVVTMLMTTIVISALVTVLTVTSNEATREFSTVDSTQRARDTLTKLEGLLQSACLTSGVTPIQAGSTADSLWFESASGNAAQPTPTEYEITFYPSSGELTEEEYAVNGGSAPDWTFSSTPIQQANKTNDIVLLNNVNQSGSTPVFQYFAYQEVPNGSGGYYSDVDGQPYEMLLDGTSSVPDTNPPVIPAASPLSDAAPSGLSSTNAQATAEVLITLAVAPSSEPGLNTTISGGTATVTDSIVLRLTPPPNNAESGGAFGPCE